MNGIVVLPGPTLVEGLFNLLAPHTFDEPTCASCAEPVDAVTAAYVVTELGPLGAPPVGVWSLCSPECLRDLGDQATLVKDLAS